MAKEIGNNDLIETWASTGTAVEPSVGKIAGGWEFEEQPPHEYMNWIHNHLGQKINHLMRSGVPAWNTVTPYVAGDVAGHLGALWIAQEDSTASEPTILNTDWVGVPNLTDIQDEPEVDFATSEEVREGLRDDVVISPETAQELLALAGAPVGQVALFYQSVAPSGWLILKREPVTALYPDLRAHLLAQPDVEIDANGDPFMPEVRGEFLRALDAGRGVDPGRTLGSDQGDEIRAHSHDLSVLRRNIDGNTAEGDASVRIGDAGVAGYIEETGGSETRPRNVAFLVCIKAFDAVVPTGQADLDQLLNAVASEAQAGEGVNNTQLMTPVRTAQAIAARCLGVDQTRQDVTASRAANTTYQNTTDAPLWVHLETFAVRRFSVSNDGVNFTDLPTINEYHPGIFLILPGEFYRLNGTFSVWWEIS